jgi:hypothetical protein
MSEGGIKDLVVGLLLRTEDGKLIRYLGKGTFDLDAKLTADDLLKKYGK